MEASDLHDTWLDVAASNVELLRVLGERSPQPRDGVDLLRAHLHRACLVAHLGPAAEARDAVADAATSAQAAAVAAARGSGRVVLAGGRAFPAAGQPITPGAWLGGWAAALVARDAAAREALELADVLDATAAQGDTFWSAVLPALVLAARRDPVAPGALDAAVESAGSAGPRIVEPGYVEHLVLPVLETARRLAVGDGPGLADDTALAVARHREWYAADERAFDPMGLLPLVVLGLVCRARDDGLELDLARDLLPPDLVAGPTTGDDATGRVTYEYPPGRARSADEVSWFLDLEKFPRDRRTHAVVGRDGALVAAYEVSGAPGLDLARLDVELVDAGSTPAIGDLVDAGDLVTLADRLAVRAGGHLPLSRRRALLAEAAGCVAAALDLLGLVADPADAIVTDRGRAAYDADPRRFTVERLEAVRRTWRAQVREWAEEDSARGARQDAAASLTALRMHVEPILALLGRDSSGEVAAGLRPRDDDYAKVFTAESAAEAARLYGLFWQQPWHSQVPSGDQTDTRCRLAPAGMLGDDNELSRPFPLGYRQLVGVLDPHVVWATWTYARPGSSSGLTFDGLAWCGDHWSWFPRPYRVLRPLVEV